MSDQDREALKAFANGQAFISGHAVKFPLQVKVDRDQELETSIMGDEDFINELGNEILVYKTKKYGIPCERKFEINKNNIIESFTSSGCI